MHWVDRGPEPTQLASIRATYTEGWILFYRNRIGNKPRDTKWLKFAGDLKRAFHGICAYCETRCRGQVEHFHPKSRYPELVYRWANWLLVCNECNFAKSRRAFVGGCINPCAAYWFGHPERYFTFDTKTGRIHPKRSLPEGSRRKAQQTIDYLRLNDIHHMKNRFDRLALVAAKIGDDIHSLSPELQAELDGLASRESPWSSVVRVWLSELGYIDGK